MSDETTRLKARVKVLEDALRVADLALAGANMDMNAVERKIKAALAASQPADPVTNAGCCQSVKVKPLEWRNSYGVLRAKTLFGDYIITRHILKLLSGSEQVHDDTEAAKAAAQADYEGRILSALEPAPRVSETPKSEHDRADVLTALEPAPVTVLDAPAEDAITKGETAGQTLDRLGMDGAKWAAEFRTTALRLGYSDMDEGWLIGWFCNAIMAGHDRAQSPDAGKMVAPVTPAEAAKVLLADKAALATLVDVAEEEHDKGVSFNVVISRALRAIKETTK